MKDDKKMDHLIRAFLSLEDSDTCRRFLADITTPKELKDMKERLDVARLLYEGKTYEKIIKETGMSSTTIARINRTLHDGEDGYKEVLEKIKDS